MEGKCGLFPADRSRDLRQRVIRFVGAFVQLMELFHTLS